MKLGNERLEFISFFRKKYEAQLFPKNKMSLKEYE